MGRWLGSRGLLAISTALAILLAAFAVVQYRWSTRVAAADEQREREHLNSAASLFAAEFNATVAQTVAFLQEDARVAQQAGAPVAAVPKLIGELYYLNIAPGKPPEAQRLAADRRFLPSPVPDWLAIPRCAAVAMEQPTAIVIPIFDLPDVPAARGTEMRIVQSIGPHRERCFVARLDERYLHEMLPQLIERSFGPTETGEYHFAVVSRERPGVVLYGSPAPADLTRPFFSIVPTRMAVSRPRIPAGMGPGSNSVIVQRTESTVVIKGSSRVADLFGPGIWELQVAHKGVPLAAVFERGRRRDLVVSLGVELLLLLAIAALVVAARHMQKLATQKMEFVAGVSHELRTPVSAIAMLSRNQADGLVSGADRVKQYGELIHQQSRRLNEMVEQTLQYAGIHSGLRRPARHQVDLRQLIHDAVDARRAELASAGFEVEIAVSPDLPSVLGDASLLRTAFDNLLTNAYKYAGGGRWIRVSARYDAPTKEVAVSVEDRGAGIDMADQAEIFEPFCRGRAAIEAQIPGSGLGLSLVRSAAEAHRGTVTLVSQTGRGSTFTMHLPV